MMTIEQLTTEIQNLVREVQRLVQETNQLKLATQLANPVQPLPVPTPTPTGTLPPRPGSPGTGAANHLADLLNNGMRPAAPPHSAPAPVVPPEVMARYSADQKAYANAFRAMGPMGAFHLHIQPPNLMEYRNNHDYIWPGHALIAAHPGGNARTI